MIESPVAQRWQAESLHEAILAVLKDRFGNTGRDIPKALRTIRESSRLVALNVLAANCPDLETFADALLS